MLNIWSIEKDFLQKIKIIQGGFSMKTENSIQELKREIEKFSKKISNRTALFIILGFVIALVSVVFLIVKVLSCSCFTFLQTAAMSAVKRKGVTPVIVEKYSLNFALKENPHTSSGVSIVKMRSP